MLVLVSVGEVVSVMVLVRVNPRTDQNESSHAPHGQPETEGLNEDENEHVA